ncbi:MAG: hypothetical protein Ct9H300mP12_06160 [Acidimicrobiales bacterium]|nr:MAG: hypothetical protein Ct9H300mP12_06160 [Acidimicrobiales bacterium]
MAGQGFTFEALHTPGHISNHLCFALQEEDTLFTGDHVMGWSTTVVPAPDGDPNHYLANLRPLLERPEAIYRPTHGPAITNPVSYVSSLIKHREHRERQIIDALNPKDPATLSPSWPTCTPTLTRNSTRRRRALVYAHLLALSRSGRAVNPRNDR